MAEYRSIDGSDNNPNDAQIGQTGEQLVRVSPNAYGDGISSLAGADRPGAREVSNEVLAETGGTGNSNHLSSFLWMWGQFIDHDITLTEPAEHGETANIPVPEGDPYFDPAGSGDAVISLTRSVFDEATGKDVDNPREQINQITPWMDASQIYGSDAARAEALRGEGGKLKMSEGGLLQYNTYGLPNAMTTNSSQFLSGDVRANENVALTSLHTLFSREHNQVVDELAEANPDWGGETLYQEAKKTVEAKIQIITYNEFLPHLLGEGAIEAWDGYRADVDPQIANEFSTAAFRLGHTLLSSQMMRVQENGEESEFGHLALRDAFFRPDRLVNEGGVDDILRGAGVGESQELDNELVDDVRNFLFGNPGQGGFDLGSLNIQRGRDHGLSDYNTVREAYGLERVETFADITGDVELQNKLADLYGTVDNIDLYVGGLMEDPVEGSMMGELFHTIVVDQFTRLRDGDDYWHENQMDADQLKALSETTLAGIIERNSDIQHMQDDAFISYSRTGGTEDDDMLYGSGDRDLLAGYDGDDILMGGEGTQQIEGDGGQDKVYAGAGDDVVYGGYEDDNLHGETGADSLDGGYGADYINGGAGDDIINGGAGDDCFTGGEGQDQFIFSQGQDVVFDFTVSDDVLDFSKHNTIGSKDNLVVQTYDTGILVGDGQGNDTWLAGVNSLDDVNMVFDGTTDVSSPYLQGGADEMVVGTAGDDRFLNTDGTQYFYGKGGNDCVKVNGNRDDFTLNKTEDCSGFVLWSQDSVDLFWDIEQISFDDGDVELAEAG